MNWIDLNTAEKMQAIRRVYQPGMSASKIAACIPGATRASVAGFYFRHKLALADVPLDGKPGNTPGKPRKMKGRNNVGKYLESRARSETAKVFREPAPPSADAVAYDQRSRRITLIELDRSACRWPVNTPEPGQPYLFCGCPTEPRSSYCAHHNARAFNPEAVL